VQSCRPSALASPLRTQSDEIHRDGLDAELRNIRETGERTGSVVVVCGAGIPRICSSDKSMEGREYFGGLEGGQIEEAAPDLGGGKIAGRKACDYAKVVGAAFEGTPEVGII